MRWLSRYEGSKFYLADSEENLKHPIPAEALLFWDDMIKEVQRFKNTPFVVFRTTWPYPSGFIKVEGDYDRPYYAISEVVHKNEVR